MADREAVSWIGPSGGSGRYEPRSEMRVQGAEPDVREGEGSVQGAEEDGESVETWRDRALRLQAEIENYRKRQQRLAEERVAADRDRLLRAFVTVADDLERALNSDGTDTENLRQGVDLTYRNLMRLMEREGAEPIQTEGQPFDPALHEAVGTVPHERVDAEPDMVVEVVQTGYQLQDRLLRPARVIVAT
jgi:molecular chaperone GrpE